MASEYKSCVRLYLHALAQMIPLYKLSLDIHWAFLAPFPVLSWVSAHRNVLSRDYQPL